jgi:hypothetical protein
MPDEQLVRTFLDAINMTEDRGSLNCAIMYLAKGIGLLLVNEVDSVLVLGQGPQPEHAEGRPLVLIHAQQTAVNETRLCFVRGAGGDEEGVC